MSQYPNGQQGYYGQPANPQASVQPSTSRYDNYSSHNPAPDQHLPRRMPSYNAGDDSGYFNPAQTQNARATEVNAQYSVQGGGYGGHSSQGAYNAAQGSFDDDRGSRYSRASSDAMSPMAPSRASSQTSAMSYQYPYSGATSSQPAYNPQQYGLPQTQSQPVLSYNPQTYSGSNNTSYPTPNSGHQPYNPAAYQSTAVSGMSSPVLHRRQSAASQYGQTSATPQTYGFSHQPPLPPPRSPEHPYGGRPYQSMLPNSSPSYVPSSPPNTMNVTLPTSYSYYSSPQGAAYEIPSQYTPAIPSPSFEDQPPIPPVHQTQANGFYGKRPSISHSGSRRSLPIPPGQSEYPEPPPRRTDTLTRHPQSRPLPGPPVDETGTNGSRFPAEVPMAYEDVLRQDEVAYESQNFARRHSSRASHASSASRMHFSPDEEHAHTNGNMETGTGHVVNYDAYSDDSEAEAAAGLAMLQEDNAREDRERERLEGRMRRETNASILSSRGSNISPRGQTPNPDPRDNDFIGHDLALYEGGYQANLHYGDDIAYSSGEHSDPATGGRFPGTSGSFRSADVSPDERGDYYAGYEHPPIAYEYANRFHHMPPDARVDAGGTGGLSAPDAFTRRMSFDYGDEGETPYAQTRSGEQSDDDGPYQGVPEDLFFHPGMRPLPPAPAEPAGNEDLVSHLMPAGTYNRHLEQQDGFDSYSQYNNPSLPTSADAYGEALLSPSPVPRSSSLSTPIGPRTDAPIRSKTDADRVRYKQQQQELLMQLQRKHLPPVDPTAAAAAAMTLDLPSIPAGRRKKFNPAKLSSEQFKKCSEPWALSSLLSWIRDLSEDETDLREHAIADAMVALFTHKVPTMNIADAETLAARVVSGMLDQGALVKEEEWVKFGSGTISGVLFQITGTGCYSPRLHLHEMHIEHTDSFARCYSHHCMRTLKKVNLKAQMMAPQKKAEDWVTFYKVTKEVIEARPKKEIDRQNNLHEIVTTEDYYISQLDVLRELYRDQLAKMNPSIIPPKRLPKFLADVFGKVDAVKKVNEDFLLAQLKYRQKEQGPFISGFSDIFREWIRKAKYVYIAYAATFPTANYLMRKESERNPRFKLFLDQARDHKLSNRLSWDTFLKAPITRIQRYGLLLKTIHDNMVKDSEEKTNVAQAIAEIRIVASECDNKVGEMNKKADLMELAAKLQLRPDMKKEVELNLEHLGRRIIHRGELQRPGTRTRFLVETHAILFDHYLVLAKAFTVRDGAVKYERYDISKLPIPMDLLCLESTDDDPVVKSSVRGVATVTPSQAGAASPLTHNGSSASGGNGDDKMFYPFKIKHLGKTGTYTLYAFSAQSRIEWCHKIIEAKTKHAAALFSQNAEPFRLRVLADTAFGYSDHTPGSKSVTIKGTPLHRAIQEVEKQYENSKSRPPPICRLAVNCATVFQQPAGRIMCAIGTDYGLFMSELNNPRGWYKAIPITRVSQVAVFEDFNLLLLIADRSLIAYHLDVVCPANGKASQSSQDSSRRAPQKLSGNREVGFFAAGRLKDRYLVMYKKREGLSSTFKVLEPVLQKSSTNKTRLFTSRRSQTEFFREYDEFYIPAETYRINMFHSSLAISTHKGIEVLTLDKKHSWSVPDFSTNETSDAQDTLHSIANRIANLRPLGMFRLSESEFIVAYQQCAVYVNKHGDVSRSVVMEFVGNAHTACLYGKFLMLFNEDFVEVRNAMNGRLRQVIPGHNVVCIDDGSKTPGALHGTQPHVGGSSFASGFSGATNGSSHAGMGNTVKICMQHPEDERRQIVLELIENEGQKD
ncbi:hypothetical protein N7457_001227 [Penicillium paradoxum]|uniref:uncharacterized protein n=1 Tax=Penicillium paradoxum TaxID=176176 RepID=UPI002547B4ED|nr:uncharacterized protein N7457_001227 [Penicillium paradoxum]KAJ5794628.1 hypothetical protein N7457_001227 [Penicillium paradoxum]